MAGKIRSMKPAYHITFTVRKQKGKRKLVKLSTLKATHVTYFLQQAFTKGPKPSKTPPLASNQVFHHMCLHTFNHTIVLLV